MKQANPRLIGAFVLGGVALAVVALIYLSSQDLFAKKRRFVLYFQQSVKGLRLGAPVQLRGIPIGEVIAIEGIYEPDQATITPRITIEVKPETLLNVELPDDPTQYPVLPALEPFGLRASLRSQSLLTGQLYVSLDFLPDEPERKLGGEVDSYPEMPTVDSGLDRTLAKIQDLPIEEALVQATDALAAAERLIEDPMVRGAIRDFDTLMKSADEAITELRNVASLLKNQLDEDGQIDALVKDADNLILELRGAAARVNERVDEDGALNQELLTALREISSAARSVRALADELERRPESLLRGK